MTLLERTANRLAELRAKRPLVHNITNYVVMNSTANTLLALGASPVMAHAEQEVEEMAGLAGALVLNIGTLSEPWIRAMFKAAKAAHARNIPVILDPVGAGATQLRTQTAKRLLAEAHPTVVRGNASEILALGNTSGTRGVDAAHTVEQARETALTLSRQHQTTFAVTGPEDFVTDGTRSARIRNGHPLLARVTGTGCAATAVIGAFAAVEPDAFNAAVEGLVLFGIAGELAAQGNPGPGAYQVKLFDALASVSGSDVQTLGKVLEK